MTTRHDTTDPRLIDALTDARPSTRLHAALRAGSYPDPDLVEALVDRCRTEPDFFVRDMLTWALTRQPAERTVPLLLAELRSEHAQARSQALHTLAKIGDRTVWDAIPQGLLHDADAEVARSAWRAAVALVPSGEEARLAAELAAELGRGDRATQLSLSRALVALGEPVPPLLARAGRSDDGAVRAHALATEELLRDPDSEFTHALDEATRIVLTGSAPRPEDRC